MASFFGCGDIEGTGGSSSGSQDQDKIDILFVNDYAESIFTVNLSSGDDTALLMQDNRIELWDEVDVDDVFELEEGDTVSADVRVTAAGDRHSFQFESEPWDGKSKEFVMIFDLDSATLDFKVSYGWN